MRRRALLPVLFTPVGLLGLSTVALGFWTVGSAGGTGSAAADALSAPSAVSTSGVSATAVTVNVTTGPVSGPTPSGYRVDRTSPSPVTSVCTISGATGACTDSAPVSGQTNTYAVYSRLGSSWVSSSGATTSAVVPSPDTTPPTTTATPSPTPNAAAWDRADVTVSLAASDNPGGTGVKQITYSATGAQAIASTTTAGSAASVLITAEGTTTVSFFATDNAGNSETAKTLTVKLDKTGPSNALSLTSQTGNPSYLNGSTIYYQGASAGQFSVSNAVVDALSGPASSTTALGGTSTGWSHTGSTVSTPTSGPYVSGAFSWGVNTSSSPTATVTAADVAGNTTATVLSLVDDRVAPSGGSVTYSSASTNGTSATISFATGTDAGSGVNPATAQLQRATATYSGATCGTFGTFTTVATAPTSPYTDTLPSSSDACYRYQYVVSDRLANSVTYTSSNTLIRDTTAPAAPSAPALTAASDSGTSSSDKVTNVSTPSFTGTAEAGSTITLFNGTTAVGTGTTNGSGTYTATVSPALADGVYTLTAKATDAAGNSSVASAPGVAVTIDLTRPLVSSVALANGNGSTAGTADSNDSVTVVFSERIGVSTLCSAWTNDGQAQSLSANNDVTVTITDAGANDVLTVSSGTCALRFGSLALGANYVTGAALTFNGSGSNKSAVAYSPSTRSLTVTLGGLAAGSGTPASAVPASSVAYTPSATVTDVAGNAISGTGSATSQRF